MHWILEIKGPHIRRQTYFCFLLMTMLLCESGCQSTNSIASFNGKRVDAFLQKYALNLGDAELEDEPPGKLKKLTFRENSKLGGRSVSLRVVYTPELFSESRDWNKALVKRATIESVSEEDLLQSANEPSKNLDPMLDAAKSEYEQGHLDAAERILHKILDLNPTNQKALYYLGLVARQKYLQTHPGQPRATQPPEKLPVPVPFPRQNLKPKITSTKVAHKSAVTYGDC